MEKESELPSLAAISESLKSDTKFSDIQVCLQAELKFVRQKFNLLEKELKCKDNLRPRTEKKFLRALVSVQDELDNFVQAMDTNLKRVSNLIVVDVNQTRENTNSIIDKIKPKLNKIDQQLSQFKNLSAKGMLNLIYTIHSLQRYLDVVVYPVGEINGDTIKAITNFKKRSRKR